MKWAYPFGTPETEAPLLGVRGEPDVVFPRLKEWGYRALEPFVRDPKRFDAALFGKQANRYGLEIAAVGTGPVVSDDKLTFASSDAETRAAAVKRAKDIVDFASRFGSPVIIGKLRGEIDVHQPEQSWQWMREGFDQVCEYAERNGVVIAIEPQNQMVINNVNTTQEGIAFIQSANCASLKLMLDVHHMNMEDRSLALSFLEAKAHLVHMHIADSNRQAPGKGNMNFPEIIRMLKAMDYQHYCTLEIAQGADSLTTAKEAMDYLRSIEEKVEIQ